MAVGLRFFETKGRENMSYKLKSAEVIHKFIKAFRCPHCESPFDVVGSKSLMCRNNHTFDLAKQGYVNLMTRPSKSHYHKELFEARQKIMMESDLYTLLHENVAKTIKEYSDHPRTPLLIFDAGCGEGSHLQKILDQCRQIPLQGIGLDISKDGIVMAAKNYKEPIWLVGDLAKSPIADQSIHVILNILSPSNYKEFKRILVPNGLVIKVVPGPNYLIELREALFGDTKKGMAKNEETVELFKKHFHLKDAIPLCYTKGLTPIEFKNLVQMSPLSWNLTKSDMDVLMERDCSEITIDLKILIGRNQ
jgi:23S rRNA (guanine745-N1)-methyltransferase